MRILSEYSTSTTTIGMGSWIKSYSCLTCPTKGSGSGRAVTDKDIQTKLVSLITSGYVPMPDLNTYYAIHFAPGITIQNGSSKSCVVNGFCAYHYTLRNTFTNKATVPYIYYGIMPDMSGGACATGCGSSTTMNNLFSVSSHELAEAVTDPAVGVVTTYSSPLSWYDPNYGEVGDMCGSAVGITVGGDGVTYYIQKQWSNTANACVAS